MIDNFIPNNSTIQYYARNGMDEIIKKAISTQYKYGFVTNVDSDSIAPGINETVIKLISNKKQEPSWLLDFRIEAYKKWLRMAEPTSNYIKYQSPNFQKIVYYSAPKTNGIKENQLNIDHTLFNTFEKLGVPLQEKKKLEGVAVDIIFDSISVATTYKKKLASMGIIFCGFSEAVQLYPNLIERYLGSVVPNDDNFYAALNSAVFTDGSFCFIPKNIKCPIELSTYFRINNKESGQFERTLIIAEDNTYVSYLEGCTAPQFDTNQLHAAVVELVAHNNASIKYSTIQNWYAGNEDGVGGIFNFVTKRGLCQGANSKISWTQVETGSSVTIKYPSCILLGDNSIGEFYSVALTNNKQQTDTGTKMIHIGKNTRSTIISKGISTGNSINNYIGLVKIDKNADKARNFSQCDSLLIGKNCSAITSPYININNQSSKVEHEATTSKIGDDQLFYFQQRGITKEDAISMIVTGFCKDVFRELPMEFAVEATKLLNVKLENSTG